MTDWDETRKPEFDSKASEISEESTRHISPFEAAKNRLDELEQQRKDKLLEKTPWRENAKDVTQQPPQPEHNNEQQLDAPALELNPPEYAPDRSTERDDAMADIIEMAEAAKNGREEFNRASGVGRGNDRVSPTLMIVPMMTAVAVNA